MFYGLGVAVTSAADGAAPPLRRPRLPPARRGAGAFRGSLSLARCRPGGPQSSAAAMSTLGKAPGALKSVDYEVFGRVQGEGRGAAALCACAGPGAAEAMAARGGIAAP